jgi:hypothetical protein
MWFLYLIILILVAYIVYTQKKEQKNTNLEQLKNALLTYHMTEVFANKIERGPITTVFDGSSLPPLSGYNLINACFSYIMDEDEFKKHPFYTQTMAMKHKAIDRFLELNLNTREQVTKFFDDVTNKKNE